MKTEKHPCSEFIVAAIREMRPKTFGLKANTASGVQLAKVFSVVSTFYSGKEFTRALSQLLHKNLVILSASVVDWSQETDDERSTRYFDHRVMRIIDAPPAERCAKKRWSLDEKGEKEVERSSKKGQLFSEIRLHVKEDGLPARISGLLADLTLYQSHNAVRAIAARIYKKVSEKHKR